MSAIARDWSEHFGLAATPLFEPGEVDDPSQHSVLLDGGNGSFVLSEKCASYSSRELASWAWSGGFVSHVGVTNTTVSVVKWDNPDAVERFTLRSIAEKLDAFYAYLSQQSIKGRPDVVATLLDLFRAVRGEIQASGADDRSTVAEFLDIFAQLLAADRPGIPFVDNTFDQLWGTVKSGISEAGVLPTTRRERLEAGFRNQIASLLGLKFSAVLAARHAASAIFQEAHFAFRSSVQPSLFGYQPPDSTRHITRGAHHFTPPPLARSLVEQALRAIPDVGGREELTVCDPACGSGAFLTEAARALRRLGFAGKLRLLGRDISEPAILMARFAVHANKLDWEPPGGTEIDLQVADALAPRAMPSADLIIMNPPFLAWLAMEKNLKERVGHILGPTVRQRPDLSMAFVTLALRTVTPGGVVASLLPSSILGLNSARDWRHELLDKARLAFLGSFGEYGLFVHALVQVSAVVLVRNDEGHIGVGLKSRNETIATGEALRALRRLQGPILTSVSGKGWRITPVDRRALRQSDSWRILPLAVEHSLERLEELGITHIADTFDVRQGILTGLNEAFVLTSEQLDSLPKQEQKYFRPALFRDAIASGRIRPRYFVFFPYDGKGTIFADENELRKELPTYFRGYLVPHEPELRKRSGVVGGPDAWWLLTRPRQAINRNDPRILTKYFGTIGDIVVDETGSFVPIQGYAWFLKGRRAGHFRGHALVKVLQAYYTILNSPTFTRLLKVFSHPVAGGQFNLSIRFVSQIPIVDLTLLEYADLVDELRLLAAADDLLSPRWLRASDELAVRAWGADLAAALGEMDDA